MRHPRTRRRWQHVFGLVVILALGIAPVLHPVGVFADAGNTTPEPVVTPTPTTAPVQYRMTLTDLNLRTDPAANADVLSVVPQNTIVIFLGQTNGIYAEIKYNDVTGWVVAEYLLEGVDGSGAETAIPATATTTTTTTPPAGTETPLPTTTGTVAPTTTATTTPGTVTPTETPAITETVVTDPERVLLESVNLRDQPNANAAIITVLDKGLAVTVTGRTSGLYSEITAGSSTGWVATQYLGTPGSVTPSATTTATTTAPTATSGSTTETVTVEPTGTATTTTPAPTGTTTPEPTVGPTQAPSIPAGNSLIIWPFKDGTWEVTQGYHGSSHQNNSSLWQYGNSFDLVRDDAETAGQPIYSPVNGTIRWFDPSTGGISIDMGNGYAFAMFHLDVDPGLVVGQALSQGQYVGTIAGPGGGGNGGFPHVHITVWATTDGGNWSRQSVPFVGQLAISGAEFPDTGASYEHTGYIVHP